MSYADGWAAIHLEMPGRVPRTEYSADFHWDLVKAVTGIAVTDSSPEGEREQASLAFERAWNYDFLWRTGTDMRYGKWETDMGHAEYKADGSDYREKAACPFSTVEEVLSFDFMANLGPRPKHEFVRLYNEGHSQMRARHSTGVCTSGIYHTTVSGFIQIFGWDMLLLAAGEDQERFGALMNRYAAWVQQYFDAMAESDIPVIMVHDDIVWTSGAFMRPDWYRRFIFPNYKKFFAPLREAGKKITYTSDGNYTEFIDDIAAAGADGFVMEPTTDMAYIAERYGKTHYFIGNADCRILLSGSGAAIRAEVERCMRIGKKCPGFFMAVGNHIPPNTPVENALYYNEVYEELGRR